MQVGIGIAAGTSARSQCGLGIVATNRQCRIGRSGRRFVVVRTFVVLERNQWTGGGSSSTETPSEPLLSLSCPEIPHLALAPANGVVGRVPHGFYRRGRIVRFGIGIGIDICACGGTDGEKEESRNKGVSRGHGE